MGKKKKKEEVAQWYLWVRYGEGHIRYVDAIKLSEGSEKRATKWGQKIFKELQKEYRMSECYITYSTGVMADYKKIKIFKDFYWIKKNR